MNKIFLTVTVGPDYRLLPKFLRYYKNIGIDHFLVILNTLDLAPIEILQDFGIKPVKYWSEPFSETSKQHYERNEVVRHCDGGDWVIYADLDEFQYYPMGIKSHIDYCEKNKINFLEGRLIDRISETGELIKIDDSKSLEEQFPLGGFITNNLLKAWDKKIVIARVRLIVGGGHHIFLDSATHKTLPYMKSLNKHSQDIEIHHFKWDEKVLLRMSRYLQLPDESLTSWRKEMKIFYTHHSVHGRINIHDEKLGIKKIKNFINI